MENACVRVRKEEDAQVSVRLVEVLPLLLLLGGKTINRFYR